MSAHTPAPWLYRPCDYDDWGWVRSAEGRLVAKAIAPTTIAEEVTHRRNGTDPYEANARLIAAAPDLLQALKGMLDQPETPDAYAEMMDRAEAAIAKAEGR